MKKNVLFLVLLLPACATFHKTGGEKATVPETRNAEVQSVAQSPARQRRAPVPKPAQVTAQKPAQVIVQPPATVQSPPRSEQGDSIPKKRGHNIEED